MQPIPYFKLQAKNLFKDFPTKTLVKDERLEISIYEYKPTYFNVDEIVISMDLDEENFSLMNAQHVIAYLCGFDKWTDLIKASDVELELAKLVFDNQHKIGIEDWQMYIAGAEADNKTTFDAEDRLEIFKHVFVNVEGHHNSFGDLRIKVQKPKSNP